MLDIILNFLVGPQMSNAMDKHRLYLNGCDVIPTQLFKVSPILSTEESMKQVFPLNSRSCDSLEETRMLRLSVIEALTVEREHCTHSKCYPFRCWVMPTRKLHSLFFLSYISPRKMF